MAPPPPLGRLPGEKSPSTRPKYSARQQPAPGLPLATSPSPSLGPGAANPVTCPLGKTSSPGLCASRPVPWQRPPPSCASQLVAGVASPGGAHDLGTGTLATRRGILARTPLVEWPRASCALLRLYPPRSLGAPPPCLQSARAFGPRLGAHGLDKSLCSPRAAARRWVLGLAARTGGQQA